MTLNNVIVFIGLCVIGFFVGGIPSGYLFAKWYKIDDIRTVGSGNIGASNIGRILGRTAFVIVFLLDAIKAILFLLYTKSCIYSFVLVAVVGLVLLLGNCFSPFLQFNGGKGVATLLGIVGVFSPIVMCCAVVVWLIVVVLTKVPAIASVCTLCTLPFLSYYFISFSFIPFLLVASLIILWKHKKNFKLIGC